MVTANLAPALIQARAALTIRVPWGTSDSVTRGEPLRRKSMDSDRTICVMCAWRKTCNKKFSMDGATTTRCPEYTKDLTLDSSDPDRDKAGKEE